MITGFCNPIAANHSKRVEHVTRILRNVASDGYSILELVAVIFIIAILAGLATPNVLKAIKFSRIDQAKSVLNSAIAECLEEYRTDTANFGKNPLDEKFLNGVAEGGYRIMGDKDKCGFYMIEPTDNNEDYMFPIGFRIFDDGTGLKVEKIAIPAKNRESELACKSWGTCGIPPELQAEWDRLAALAKSKSDCEEDYFSWLRRPSSGQFNRWDSATNTCSLTVWAFDGNPVKDEEAMKAAREAKYGAICAAKFKKNEETRFDGLFQDADCGTSYYCSGKDLGPDKVKYDACREEQNQTRCTAALGNWKTSGFDGQFSEPGCTTVWKCKGRIYNTEADFASSDCGCTWQDVEVGVREDDSCTNVPKFTTKCGTFGCFPVIEGIERKCTKVLVPKTEKQCIRK